MDKKKDFSYRGNSGSVKLFLPKINLISKPIHIFPKIEKCVPPESLYISITDHQFNYFAML